MPIYLKIMLDTQVKSSHSIAMNKLPLEKRILILSMLCEGSSMRSVSRVAGVSFNTVTKLLVNAGTACAAYHDEHVRGLKSERVQCDETWSFIYAKAKTAKSLNKNGAGDAWTWTALDADSKMIISYMVGQRDAECASIFMDDVKSLLANKVQLTTDGHKVYLGAVEVAFGDNVDYAMLVKLYGDAPEENRKYSVSKCTGTIKKTINGIPKLKTISTSFVERQNLNMRMGMRRFTRLTNAFSKKLENHCHALALYFMFYNFVRIHKTLKVAPAMEAGLTSHLWEMKDIDALIQNKAPKKRGSYKKEISN